MQESLVRLLAKVRENNIILLTTALFALVILLISGGIYARPIVDDYRLQTQKTQMGTIAFTQHLSENYSPRYVYHFMLSVFYATANRTQAVYAFTALITITAQAFLLLISLRIIAPGLKTGLSALIILTIISCSILAAPLYYHVVYWMPGAFNYPIIASLFMLAAAIIYKQKYTNRNYAFVLAGTLLTGYLINELFAVMIIYFSGVILLKSLLVFRRSKIKEYSFYLSIVITSILVLFLFQISPGTQKRIGEVAFNTHHGLELVQLTLSSSWTLLAYPFAQIWINLLVLSVGAIIGIKLSIGKHSTAKFKSHSLLLWGWLFYILCSVGFAFIALYSGTSESYLPPHRVRYIISFVFILMLLFSATVLTFIWVRKKWHKPAQDIALAIALTSTIAIAISMVAQINKFAFNAALTDMRAGYLYNIDSKNVSEISLPCIRYDAMPDYSDHGWIEESFKNYYGINRVKLNKCTDTPAYSVTTL